LSDLGTARAFLPSCSPELDPAERVFEEVGRHIEGRIYESLHEKREETEIHLKELSADPQRAKSLCGWGWLRESLESLPLKTSVHQPPQQGGVGHALLRACNLHRQ
jgi:transposase